MVGLVTDFKNKMTQIKIFHQVKKPRPTRVGKKSQGYNEDSLKAAVKEVGEGTLSIRGAMRKYGIPRTTIRAKLQCSFDSSAGDEKPLKGKCGPDTAISPEGVFIIETYLLEMAERGFPLRMCDVKKDIPQILKEAGIDNKFKDGMPSDGYVYSKFLPQCTRLSSKGVQPQPVA